MFSLVRQKFVHFQGTSLKLWKFSYLYWVNDYTAGLPRFVVSLTFWPLSSYLLNEISVGKYKLNLYYFRCKGRQNCQFVCHMLKWLSCIQKFAKLYQFFFCEIKKVTFKTSSQNMDFIGETLKISQQETQLRHGKIKMIYLKSIKMCPIQCKILQNFHARVTKVSIYVHFISLSWT